MIFKIGCLAETIKAVLRPHDPKLETIAQLSDVNSLKRHKKRNWIAPQAGPRPENFAWIFQPASAKFAQLPLRQQGLRMSASTLRNDAFHHTNNANRHFATQTPHSTYVEHRMVKNRAFDSFFEKTAPNQNPMLANAPPGRGNTSHTARMMPAFFDFSFLIQFVTNRVTSKTPGPRRPGMAHTTPRQLILL